MNVNHNLSIVLAHMGDLDVSPYVDAMNERSWKVTETHEFCETLNLADSGDFHAAIIACDSAADIPKEVTRSLLELQDELIIMFILKEPATLREYPALIGMTSDQMYLADSDAGEFIRALDSQLHSIISNGHSLVVMCVDDDTEFLASMDSFLPQRLQAALPRLDLDFRFFDKPAEALQEGQSVMDHLALVISDQVMPGMEGTEFLSRVKTICPTSRRVLLTGHAGLDSAVRAINEQIVDKYFSKPIDEPTDFLATLTFLVREHCSSLSTAAQRRRLSGQFEYMCAISSTANEEEAAETTTRFIYEHLWPSFSTVALLHEDELIVRSMTGSADESAVGRPFPANGRVKEWLLEQDHPAVVNTNAEATWHSDDLSESHPFLLGALVRDGVPLGVLTACSRSADEDFSRNRKMLAEFLTDALSLTIGSLRDRARIEDYYLGTMASLVETVEAKDLYTRGHTDRVRDFSVALAEKIGMSPDEIDNIRRGASLHDIGKIAIPDEIILKPSRLTNEEYEIMKEHPARADKILQHLSFLDSARPIVRGHHERFDGKGYPDGLAGEQIDRGARVVAVADAYDAMTSARSYRGAMPVKDALAEIRKHAGAQFDPELAAAFVEMIEEGAAPCCAGEETTEINRGRDNG